jgi:hypothetical protein
VNDVTITPTDNGPYLIQGNVTLLGAEGNRFEAGTRLRSAAAASPTRNRSATAPTTALTSQPPAAPSNSLFNESGRRERPGPLPPNRVDSEDCAAAVQLAEKSR